MLIIMKLFSVWISRHVHIFHHYYNIKLNWIDSWKGDSNRKITFQSEENSHTKKSAVYYV